MLVSHSMHREKSLATPSPAPFSHSKYEQQTFIRANTNRIYIAQLCTKSIDFVEHFALFLRDARRAFAVDQRRKWEEDRASADACVKHFFSSSYSSCDKWQMTNDLMIDFTAYMKSEMTKKSKCLCQNVLQANKSFTIHHSSSQVYKTREDKINNQFYTILMLIICIFLLYDDEIYYISPLSVCLSVSVYVRVCVCVCVWECTTTPSNIVQWMVIAM